MKLRRHSKWDMEKLTDDHGIEWNVHKREKCEGSNCCLHNPSDHPLKDAPLALRTDAFKYAFAERFCEHGIGHSDPDAVAHYASIGAHGMGIHGCDGCCSGRYDEIQNSNSEWEKQHGAKG